MKQNQVQVSTDVSVGSRHEFGNGGALSRDDCHVIMNLCSGAADLATRC